jgi:hypothetical protein
MLYPFLLSVNSKQPHLRDIEACLNSRQSHLYHLGLRGPIHRSTLADANEQRDWRIYADLAQGLLGQALRLYAGDPLEVDLKQAVYALDASAIELGLSLCPWARDDEHRAAVKLQAQLDLRGWLPAAVQITPAKTQDVLWLDALRFAPGAFYLPDRGYVDYRPLHTIEQARAWLITRAKKRVRDHDLQESRSLIFLTNHFGLPALSVARLYQQRWQIELFFRWLKQHLRIKVFYGRSENAVRTQLWIVLCVYALVAIVRKQVKSQASLFEILQILSVSVFDKTPLNQRFTDIPPQKNSPPIPNQFSLFN